MKTRFLLISVIIFSFTNLYPQKAFQKKVDSLVSLNDSYQQEDKIRLSRYEELYQSHIELNNWTQAQQYVDLTIKLAKKLKEDVFVAKAYFEIGFYHHQYSRYFLAEENYFKAIEVFSNLNDKSWLGGIYQNLSAMYVNIPDYSKALDANFKAVALFYDLNDEVSVAGCYVNIASIYNGLNQQSFAIEYLNKALAIFLKTDGNAYGVALSYANLGDVYFNIGKDELKKIGLAEGQQYEKSLAALEQSLMFNKKVTYKGLLGSIYLTKGNVYNVLGNNELALEFYQKSVESRKNYTDEQEQGASLMALANFYIKLDQDTKAGPLLTKVLAIAESHKILYLQRDAYFALNQISEQQGKFGDALKYFKQYIFYKEQIFDQEKEKEITRKQLQLAFSIKENDYRSKQQLTDLALEKQLLLVKKRQQELLLKQQELAISDKEKNIQRLNFLQKEANLEHEKLEKENQIKQERLAASLRKQKTDQQLLAQENKVKINRNFSIFFAVLAIVLLAAAIFVYKAQRKTARLNQLVSAQKEELESLGKVKDRIFSVVSHDLRTPVNSLIAFIDLLENGNVSEDKLKRYAANLRNSLGHTSTMMENLLNWAYSQLQGIRPNLENLMVGNTLSGLVSTIESEASSKQIKLMYVEEGVVQAIADQDMLTLIVRNLISNAIKFTPNSGEIKVNVYEKVQQTIIEITDNGTGMSVEQMQSFNTAASKLGETTLGTNKEKGTGLGLTLCKTFAQLMDAKLSVGSNVPKGTVFTLVLPKAR